MILTSLFKIWLLEFHVTRFLASYTQVKFKIFHRFSSACIGGMITEKYYSFDSMNFA